MFVKVGNYLNHDIEKIKLKITDWFLLLFSTFFSKDKQEFVKGINGQIVDLVLHRMQTTLIIDMG